MVGGSTYHGYNSNAVFTVIGNAKLRHQLELLSNIRSVLYMKETLLRVFILGSNFRHCKW
jgi:hypothetical protein